MAISGKKNKTKQKQKQKTKNKKTKNGDLENYCNGSDLVQAFQNERWVKPGFIACSNFRFPYGSLFPVYFNTNGQHQRSVQPVVKTIQ